MVKKIMGGSYIEAIISIFVILTIINPFYNSLISILKFEKKIEIYQKLEEEIGRLRGEYKTNCRISQESIEYDIEIRESYVVYNLYKVEIWISDKKNDIKKGTILYVYKQK